ncbi:permease prefix domain 1-containing protein [Actinocatenispora rupis]|uniref:Uncharacterized protein n=1 Tax=Actinocatenispora rupis TaxID=519421 RepID=A0A8J3JFA4_9ACTN|nr:permease prefix domain 1-containing protein [Actinocatenispora rupis]GID15387.1 hypothetical protein Aru02nite_62760 [Actinocatenispora rupis]
MTDSDVDRYLDRLFDRLAGTGGAGRRALIEVEDHLRTAVSDRVEGGMSREDAEHAAVASFGDVRMVARRLRAGYRRAQFAVAASSAWLVGGLACAVAAASVLLTVADRWWEAMQGPAWGDCLESSPCDPAGETAFLLPVGIALAVVSAVLLLSRRVLQRRALLAPSARRLPALLAVLCALLTPALLTGFGNPLGVNHAVVGGSGPGLFLTVVASAVTTTATVAALGWALLRRRRRVQA